ncbi:hypothetical protein Syun_004949 [Stephania yunnanensis]|uniref:Uncharacterized protein n=1 Tax=Stephania yunnanensis TaxID=152371 RepID=A0AAP0Q1A6_9MAGN
MPSPHMFDLNEPVYCSEAGDAGGGLAEEDAKSTSFGDFPRNQRLIKDESITESVDVEAMNEESEDPRLTTMSGGSVARRFVGFAAAAAAAVSLCCESPALAEYLTVAFPVSRTREVNTVQRTLVEAWGLIEFSYDSYGLRTRVEAVLLVWSSALLCELVIASGTMPDPGSLAGNEVTDLRCSVVLRPSKEKPASAWTLRERRVAKRTAADLSGLRHLHEQARESATISVVKTRRELSAVPSTVSSTWANTSAL